MVITGGLFSSNTDLWATPIKLFETLDREFHFNLDPCASCDNHKCAKYYTIKEDGLIQDWGSSTVFINPPYGREIGKWVKKAYEHSKGGGVSVALLPCRTDTRWWGYVMEATEIRFIKGRVKFNDGSTGAPFPSCIVIWGTPRVPIINMINTDGEMI